MNLVGALAFGRSAKVALSLCVYWCVLAARSCTLALHRICIYATCMFAGRRSFGTLSGFRGLIVDLATSRVVAIGGARVGGELVFLFVCSGKFLLHFIAFYCIHLICFI